MTDNLEQAELAFEDRVGAPANYRAATILEAIYHQNKEIIELLRSINEAKR